MAPALHRTAPASQATIFMRRWFFTGMALVMLMIVLLAFIPLGDTPARHLNIYDPAGEIEVFFRDFEKNHPPGAKPDPAKAAENEKTYRVRVVGPPLKPSAFA